MGLGYVATLFESRAAESFGRHSFRRLGRFLRKALELGWKVFEWDEFPGSNQENQHWAGDWVGCILPGTIYGISHEHHFFQGWQIWLTRIQSSEKFMDASPGSQDHNGHKVNRHAVKNAFCLAGAEADPERLQQILHVSFLTSLKQWNLIHVSFNFSKWYHHKQIL